MISRDTAPIGQAFSAETFREEGHALIDRMADYLARLSGRPEDIPVLSYVPPDVSFDAWAKRLAKPGEESVTVLLDAVLQQGIHLHHPGYVGHQVSPVAPIAALASFLSAFMNNGMAVYEMGIPGTAMENAVIQMVCQTFGMPPSAHGILCHGGTLANLTALLTANSLRPDCGKKRALLVSARAHYCIERAVAVMGWGAEGLLSVPVNAQGAMDTDLLPQKLEEAAHRNLEVIAVVGSACSTATGSFDDLEAIGAFCQKHGLWFHVDGAHGAALAFSKKWRFRVAGIGQADSVTMDFHKMLLCPGLATALVVREGKHQFHTFANKASYLWENEAEHAWHDISTRSFECTKTMLSLPVYTLMHQYGTALFEAAIDRVNALTLFFFNYLRSRARWDVPLEPACNILCFRFVPDGHWSDKELDTLNRNLRRRILESGEFYLVQTSLLGKLYLRVSITNVLTREKDLSALAALAEKLAPACLPQNIQRK